MMRIEVQFFHGISPRGAGEKFRGAGADRARQRLATEFAAAASESEDGTKGGDEDRRKKREEGGMHWEKKLLRQQLSPIVR